jgi:hypothetical protein
VARNPIGVPVLSSAATTPMSASRATLTTKGNQAEASELQHQNGQHECDQQLHLHY